MLNPQPPRRGDDNQRYLGLDTGYELEQYSCCTGMYDKTPFTSITTLDQLSDTDTVVFG